MTTINTKKTTEEMKPAYERAAKNLKKRTPAPARPDLGRHILYYIMYYVLCYVILYYINLDVIV